VFQWSWKGLRAIVGRTQLQRLKDEITVAQCELSDARFDELEIKAVLSFTEYVLGNLTALWTAANVDDLSRLQETLLSTGLVWDDERFGTALTHGAFSWLRGISIDESEVASPTGTAAHCTEIFLEIAL